MLRSGYPGCRSTVFLSCSGCVPAAEDGSEFTFQTWLGCVPGCVHCFRPSKSWSKMSSSLEHSSSNHLQPYKGGNVNYWKKRRGLGAGEWAGILHSCLLLRSLLDLSLHWFRSLPSMSNWVLWCIKTRHVAVRELTLPLCKCFMFASVCSCGWRMPRKSSKLSCCFGSVGGCLICALKAFS